MSAAALEDLNRRCCSVIWHMQTESRGGQGNLQTHPLSPLLIVPKYRKDTHRISEQEARFAFVEALNGTSTHYSVETPTRQRYSFTSASGRTRSAQTDLTLHLPGSEGFVRWANVEFKAGVPKQDAANEDIEKLIGEQVGCATVGNWFGLLDGCNAGTFKTLFARLRHAIERIPVSHRVDILFCFCVLKHRTAYLHTYSAQQSPCDLDGFFATHGPKRLPGGDWRSHSSDAPLA